jgi:hypothetical protein
MKKVSQFHQPAGSNPSTADQVGAANLQLNNTESALTPEKFDKLMAKIEGGQKDDAIKSEVENAMADAKKPETKAKLQKTYNALNMNENTKKQTIDPDTKKADPSPSQLATKYREENRKLLRDTPVYNHKTAQTALKPKKKTRGNPFRVLMGKVGKLLDHGIDKSEIVRFLGKLKYWNKETISRAVDIVRDYNKQLKRDTDKYKSDDEKSDVKDDVKKELKEHKAANVNSFIKVADFDYDREPDYSKLSTAELIMRVCYLSDLLVVDKKTKQGDFKDPVSKKGVSQKLSDIKKALVDRGFDKEDLQKLGLGN